MQLQQKFHVLTAALLIGSTLGAYDEIMEIGSLDQILFIIDNDEKLAKRAPEEVRQAAQEAAETMNGYIREAVRAEGLANDGVISIADAREVNRYLYKKYGGKWLRLRGSKSNAKAYGGIEAVSSETLALNNNAVRVWGSVYDLGFAPADCGRLSNADGDKGYSYTSVGYALGEMLRNEAASGALENPDFAEVNGTTGTALDEMIEVILRDPGLQRNIATGDLRQGALYANAMNELIVEAIREEGLANDETISPADARTINRYLVEHYAKKWKTLHGDDEEGEEYGYHLVQNDGAYERMFAENVINTVADGIYHLGFYTDSTHRLLNEDGNGNASFEKVAWWLDTLLHDDMAAGRLNNPDYEEVYGTTGTTFDRIIDYIYSEPALQLKVSTDDIRASARSAEGMNRLIVEAIRATGAAQDRWITADEVRGLNAYLSNYHLGEWIVLHGDDEDNEESGYHRIQNDGAIGYAYNENVINTLADSVYHLGFPTRFTDNLTNEDGNRNASFKSVAYWLNRALAEDMAAGKFD